MFMFILGMFLGAILGLIVFALLNAAKEPEITDAEYEAWLKHIRDNKGGQNNG